MLRVARAHPVFAVSTQVTAEPSALLQAFEHERVLDHIYKQHASRRAAEKEALVRAVLSVMKDEGSKLREDELVAPEVVEEDEEAVVQLGKEVRAEIGEEVWGWLGLEAMTTGRALSAGERVAVKLIRYNDDEVLGRVTDKVGRVDPGVFHSQD